MKINDPSLEFRGVLGTAWSVFADYWFFLICVQFIKNLLSILIGGLAFAIFVDLRGWNLVIAFAAVSIAWSALQPGYLEICLGLVRNKKPKWRDLFSHINCAGQMLLATALFICAILLGLSLLIFPGFYLGIVLSLYGFILIDKKANAQKSLVFSSRLVKRHFWKVAAFIVACLAAARLLPFALEPLLALIMATLYVDIREFEIGDSER